MGSQNGTIQIYSFENSMLTLITSFAAHLSSIEKIIIGANKQFMASASSDATVKIWNLTDWSLITTYTGHSKAVTSLEIINNNSNRTPSDNDWMLISGSLDGTIQLVKFIFLYLNLYLKFIFFS